VTVIYGGSVNAENVNNYTSLENINGVLVGSESLKARSFSTLIKNAI
jgi:triosephosphate isomerase